MTECMLSGGRVHTNVQKETFTCYIFENYAEERSKPLTGWLQLTQVSSTANSSILRFSQSSFFPMGAFMIALR